MEADKRVVQRYFEIWNTGDADGLDGVLASNYVDHAHPEVSGVESVKQSVGKVRQAFPDFNITIDSIISEGDLVAVRGVVQRTQGDQLSISRVMWFVRVSDGKMTDLWTGNETQL